tara:strand:- start:1441 stop:2070 length:630 start_codon:yes stop_codon:yes gene_type:complete
MDSHFSNITVIGLCGRMGVGKDYVAKWMKEHIFRDGLIISFADMLKYQCILQSEKVCENNNAIETYNNYFKEKPPEVRSELQTYGCMMRERNPEIWISVILVSIKMHMDRGVKVFLIPDVRFSNEAEMIKKLDGYIVKVEAPKRSKLRTELLCNDSVNHISETSGDSIEADITINNDIDTEFSKDVENTIHLFIDIIETKFKKIQDHNS